MLQRKFYHSNFEKNNYLEAQDNRKKEFVGFRLQTVLVSKLKNEAQELGIDLSELIRRRLENV